MGELEPIWENWGMSRQCEIAEHFTHGTDALFLVATKRLYSWVRWSVLRFFFGLLGATYSVYTALFSFSSVQFQNENTGFLVFWRPQMVTDF